jgi:hypothetical protein
MAKNVCVEQICLNHIESSKEGPEWGNAKIEGGKNVKNAVFWDVTSCGCCKNGHFGGT